MEVVAVLARDAIPSIDDPEFGTEYFGETEDDVVVVDGTPPRAYPLRILSYHEIVNDTVDGRPIAVTWCPICWSAVVYERVVAGTELTFGVSGKLADDSLVLYDRELGSEWKQSSGQCIHGEFVGEPLSVLPSSLTTWGRFRERFPDGLVLQPARRDARAALSPGEVYDMAPYAEYRDGDAFGLVGMRGIGTRRPWNRRDLDAKTLVLGVEHNEVAKGYPRSRVEAADGVVTDRVGGLDVVVFSVDGDLTAFADPGIAFERRDDGIMGDGASWDHITGESDDGRALAPLPTRRVFAFAWLDDYDPTTVYSP